MGADTSGGGTAGQGPDPRTPADVEIRFTARRPVEDPTLGVPVEVDRRGTPRHRLVAIGDSLTHGFQSGAVFHTDLSYPAVIAYELGWYEPFRRPNYPGFGGLPLNIELLLRDLEERFDPDPSRLQLPLALFRARHWMDQVEDYWERGPGSHIPELAGINHALGIYGWDLRDTLERNADRCVAEIQRPKDNLLKQIVENANERAALRVFPTAPGLTSLTLLGAARELGDEGDLESGGGPGIETLVVLLGANNALGTVTQLRVAWSEDGYDDLERKDAFTIWRPTHFAAELAKVAAEVDRIGARHVIWGTVPHVTIAPIARGVGGKVRPESRYFPYYTRPWISDRDFDAKHDPHITEAEARAIDSAIDQYNDEITRTVLERRRDGRDWYLLDVAGILDRLAWRRYIESPTSRPDWWRPYELPPELQRLDPVPDSRFLAAGPTGRTAGGLFSLDGVHPTTVGYGVLAQELMNVMQLAGVTFYFGDGTTPRPSPVRVDFERLIRRDTLILTPPRLIGPGLEILGWADEALDLIRRVVMW